MNITTQLDQYSTIIWDWNGTLLNDCWLCIDVVNKLLQNHNQRQLDEVAYKSVFGFPIIDYYQKIGMDFNIEPFDDLTKRFIGDYDANVKQCQLQQGAIEVLNACNRNGLHQFILTAAHKESVLQLLEHYAIKDLFIEIEGLDNHRAESKVARGKLLIENNTIAKEKAVLIGDTIHDFEVANEVGVDCILIANGHQSKERLQEETAGNIAILDKIGDLLS